MASGSGRRRLRAGSNALQIAVSLVGLHGVAAADCGCQGISSVQRRRTVLARWKSLGWEAGARFTVRLGHGPGTLRGWKGLSGVSLENEVGGEASPPLRTPILHPPPLTAILPPAGILTACSAPSVSCLRGGWMWPWVFSKTTRKLECALARPSHQFLILGELINSGWI